MTKSRLIVLASTMTLGLATAPALAGCGGVSDDTNTPVSMQPLSLNQPGMVASAPKARGPASLLERFDVNNDGKLEVSELPPRARERLGDADINGDGVIAQDELAARMAKRQAERFAAADSNSDGQLTESEVSAFRWNRMKVADTNGDGKVSLEEFNAAYAQGKLGPPRSARYGGRDRAGAMGQPGCKGQPGWGKPGERAFQRFDANDDGKLEKTEVPDMVWQHLNVADTNADGAITQDEMDAAHANGTLKPPPGRGGRGAHRGQGRGPVAGPNAANAGQ
jgi:Ca2+-binding EF-hand superfamily protein